VRPRPPAAARGVHQERALLHLGEDVGVEQAAGRGQQRRMDRDEIRHAEQLVEADAFHTRLRQTSAAA